ncbi:hypothetical protein L1049_024464 [Liquidambar formosana]|uniref:Uncharacterized protein n=1 Tax=Liquidambar formosana TaxID=63359 RepID=A0AAP0S1K7_LIQFO
MDKKESMMIEINVGEQGSNESVDVDQQLVSCIRGKLLPKSPLPSRCCIFRIPISMRVLNENAFVPNVVSIGPFHSGKTNPGATEADQKKKKNLEAMERVKWWYLHSLLDRSPTGETNLDGFVKAIRDIEPDCRQCYAEQISLSSDEFVEMMVVDGCFIIELFRKFLCWHSGKEEDTWRVPIGEDDPVFNMSWTYFPLARDLLLLENQLPLQVLECLWNLTKTDDQQYTLPDQALYFFSSVSLTRSPHCNERCDNKHLLGLLRNSLLSSDIEETTNWSWEPIPCVTQLLQAGVKFKMGDQRDLLNIKFNNGVMEIPPILIQESTESVFRNLIAFEQCDHTCTNQITCYAEILDFLTDSSKDVDHFRRKGIMQGTRSTEDVAGIFNRLYNGTAMTSFFYGDLCQQVNEYYKAPWHKWKAILRRDYFNTPWAILSFSAAIVILGFTFTQTFFSILSYSNPPNQI